MDITQYSVIAIIFLAVFVQSLSGFGSALVAMSLLPMVVSIKIATPLVSVVMVFLEMFLLFYYRHSFKWEAVWRVIIASFIGIPIGLVFLKQYDERLILGILGIIVIIFGSYGLMNIRLPKLSNSIWGYVFGFVAGLLGGAYNTSGPPVIIYGNCRAWETEAFKSNLQGFFIISSLVITIGHGLSNNLTGEVWDYFLLSIPAIIIGMIAGISMDKYINPEKFRKMVLILLIMIGVRLVIP